MNLTYHNCLYYYIYIVLNTYLANPAWFAAEVSQPASPATEITGSELLL